VFALEENILGADAATVRTSLGVHMSSRRFWALVLSVSITLSLSHFVQGQTTYGSVVGLVSDPSGAAVVGATVTLTNVGTSHKTTQPSGSDGRFQFVNLVPGAYQIDVEKQGFKHFTRTDVIVQVNQSTTVDASMPIGQISETVEVKGETALLQTDTSSLGTVVEERNATELPLNGRNIYNLTAVAPSVVPQGNTNGSVVGKNPFDFANYQVGGAFANQSAEYLDGQPLNIGYINLPLMVPTQDSIGEFKVQYNNLGPEWGKFAGGVINLSTKSGTNTWHGSLYEYIRNNHLNANEWFNKRSEIANGLANTPPAFHQNQFGGTIGGAIVKDRLFVFGSYEGFRLRQGTVFTTTVPTAAERTGNFGDICQPGFDAAGNCLNPNQQLYNPLSIVGTNPTRTPIPFNNISSMINPTSAYLLNKLIANSTGSGAQSPTTGEFLNNFTKATSTGGNINTYTARVDVAVSSNQRAFVRYANWSLLSLAQDPYGTGLCKDRCTEDTSSNSVAVGYNIVAKPNLIIDLNISASRFNYLRTPINAGFDMTLEGWPASYNAFVPSIERTPLTPCFFVSDPLVSCSQGQSAIADHNTQWNFSPQVTWIKGRHTFKFGGQLEMGFDNYLQTNVGGGLIGFNGSWTSSIAGGGKGTLGGNDYADFLLGYGLGQGAQFGNQSTGNVVISGPVSGKQTYRALYAADDFHWTSKLTLNLGLRYELQGPWSERYNRLTYFNGNVVNSSVTGCSGTPGSPCPSDVFLVGTGANTSRNSLPLSKTQFMPRLGAAYALNEKTVIRGGYGIFFIPNYVSFGVNPYIDPVSSATSPFFASNNKGLTPSSSLNCQLDAAFNCIPGTGPFGANLVAVPGRNPQPNVSQYILNQNNFSDTGYFVQKYGYLQQWNLDLQRELPGNFYLDVAYAGAHGVHLPAFNPNINQIPDSSIAQAQAQANQGLTPTIAQVVPVAAYPFSQPLPGGLGPGVLIQGQLDRPYPQYAGLNLNGQGCCSSSYNALQVTANRRFGGGGTLLVAYTWGKLLSNTDTLTSWLEGSTTGGTGVVQDWNNLKKEYSLSSQNVANRLVISYVLDLPFGHGKKFGGDATGAKNALIGGWGIDGVTTFQSGFPVKIQYGASTPLSSSGLLGQSTLRPDVVGGCNKGVSVQPLLWFNPACFTAPQAWSFGNEPRVDASLKQDGIANWDFAAFKTFTFGERFNFQFRAEFFNLFNSPTFGPPNGTCCLANSGNFGQVTSTVGNPRLIQFGLKFSF
jgi:hypothetical protein